MKLLLSRKIKRGQLLREWESSEHQMTMDGLKAFEERQRKRLEAAQPAKPVLRNVLPIIKKKERA